MKRLAGSLAILFAAAVVSSVVASPKQGPILPKKTIAAAEKLLRALKLPVPPFPPGMRSYGNPQDPQWLALYDRWYQVSVDPSTGMPFGLYNFKIEHAIYRKQRNPKKRHFKTLEETRRVFMELGKRLGVPTKYVLSAPKYTEDREGIAASFQELKSPGPFWNSSKGLLTGNRVGICLDIEDGNVRSFGREWRMKVVTAKSVVDKKLAEKSAEHAFNAYGGGARKYLGGPLDTSRTILAFRVPNPSYMPRDSKGPLDRHRARVVWEVFFGKNSVFVEAESGKVSGGRLNFPMGTFPRTRIPMPPVKLGH